uniref:ATP synthase complex subunit 8 n=1 Tax=Graphium xenocles TaxID=157370 RepID=A0A8F8FFU8_9NEOP|nr:ATP synthase F0 subunit 8 [Graphium xenocles]
MPQMMPINWIILFIFFIMTFILFNMLNYYIFLYKNKYNYNSLKNQKKNLNWKW